MKLIFLYALISCLCVQPAAFAKRFAALEKQLLEHPRDITTYQKLHDMLTANHNRFTLDERKRLRALFEKLGQWSTATANPPGEFGTRIIIKGRVVDRQGRPVTGAWINVFQTDSRGYYTPADSMNKTMNEPDARLFVFLRTGDKGQFEIHTVRPGNYPKKYEGRYIPQHIHINVKAAGHSHRNIQLVFSDDPSMADEHWRKWAKELNWPVLSLKYSNGQGMGSFDLSLPN
jgi:protocatechuate 3,4-dioxygenase beta subunit